MIPLYERERPTSWDGVIGQIKAVSRLQALANRGLAGRAYWLSGQSGTGKSTIGRLIANEVADDFCVNEVDATGLTVAQLKDIERESQFKGLGKGGKAYLVNEAHGLRRDVVRQLLVMLERIPSHVVWVFTTTNEGQAALFEGVEDTSPLLSRCMTFALTSQGLCKPFAAYCKTVAEREGLDGQPIARYERFVSDRKNNLRACLQGIEAGEMAV